MLEDKDTEAKTLTKLIEKLQTNLDVGKSKQVKSIGYDPYDGVPAHYVAYHKHKLHAVRACRIPWDRWPTISDIG